MTPNLSAGGEFFWLQSNLKSGVGLAVRHTGEKHVGTVQVRLHGRMGVPIPILNLEDLESLKGYHLVVDRSFDKEQFLFLTMIKTGPSKLKYDHCCLLIRTALLLAGGHDWHHVYGLCAQGFRKDHTRFRLPLALAVTRGLGHCWL